MTRIAHRPTTSTPGSSTSGATTATPAGDARRVTHRAGDDDRYLGASGGAPVPYAAIAIPQTALGTVGDQPVVVGSDGRIGVAAPPASEADELRGVIHLGVHTAGDTNALAAVTDLGVLRGVAQRLAQAHGEWCRDTPSDGEKLELRQGRAATLMLLEDAALRASELGDGALRTDLGRMLSAALQREPFRAVRDFACNAYDRQVQAGKLPVDKVATEAIFPSAPPYEKWLKDRTVNIHFIVDNDGSKLEDAIGIFESWGLKKKALPDGSHVFTQPRYGARPAIEITIPRPADKDKGEKPELFGKMADPAVDVICYFGHAGYGHRVDHAIAHGVGGSGDGKLVLLAQCWGEGNIESLERAYPDAQMLSTTEMSSDALDYSMFGRLVEGFERQEGWPALEKGIVQRVKQHWGRDPDMQRDYHFDEHYFTPVTRTVLQKHYDRDGDGVTDAQDKIFNVVYPKRLDAAGGYDPVVQVTPEHALDGQALSRALNTLSLTVRYATMLTPAQQARVPWRPDALVPGGFFRPDDGDLRAFRFVEDPASGQVRVQLSSRFSHSDDKDLSRMLAIEAGQWFGEKAGLDDAGQVALSLCMLERAVHQQEGWYSAQSLLDEPWAEEAFLLQRYGLTAASFDGLVSATGNPDEFGRAHFKKVLDYVKAQPGLVAAAQAQPQRIGTAVDVQGEIRVAASSVDRDAVQAVVDHLGLQGRVESFSPSWLSEGQPNNLAAALRRDDGTTVVLGLGLDSEGVVRSASTLHIPLDRIKDKGARVHVEALATDTGVPPAELFAAYDSARQAGRSVAEALAEVLRALRPRVPPGQSVDRFEVLATLQGHGLADPAEWAPLTRAQERLFAQGDALWAERDFATWARGVAGTNADAIDRLYLSTLDATPGRSGPGAAIQAVLEALPAPLPDGVPPCELLDLVSSGLVAPADAAELTRVFMQRFAVTPAMLARDAVLKSLWNPAGEAGDAVRRAYEADVTAGNVPLKDAILHLARAAKEADGSLSLEDCKLLERMGLLSAGDAQLVDAGLAAIRG